MLRQARKEDAIARGEGNLVALYVDRAQGAEIWDVEGKRYIDFATGIAVSLQTRHQQQPKLSFLFCSLTAASLFVPSLLYIGNMEFKNQLLCSAH